MEPWLQTAITVFCSILASSGFWAFITAVKEKKSAKTKMILGLGHDRIIYLCMKYIDRGWITSDEYEDLKKYLYDPYQKMGGNGTAAKLMSAVDKLAIHHVDYLQQIQNSKKHPENEDPGHVPTWY